MRQSSLNRSQSVIGGNIAHAVGPLPAAGGAPPGQAP